MYQLQLFLQSFGYKGNGGYCIYFNNGGSGITNKIIVTVTCMSNNGTYVSSCS